MSLDNKEGIMREAMRWREA